MGGGIGGIMSTPDLAVACVSNRRRVIARIDIVVFYI